MAMLQIRRPLGPISLLCVDVHRTHHCVLRRQAHCRDSLRSGASVESARSRHRGYSHRQRRHCALHLEGVQRELEGASAGKKIELI